MHFMYNFGLKSCEPRAMGTHFVHSYKVATLQLELRRLRFCKPELWSALRVLLLHLKLASFQPELRDTFVPRSCEFRAGAAGVHFAYYF